MSPPVNTQNIIKSKPFYKQLYQKDQNDGINYYLCKIHEDTIVSRSRY